MATPATKELEEIDLRLQSMDGPQLEFVNGELEERKASRNSCRTALKIARLLGNFVEPLALGELYDSELGIRIFDNPEETRRAAVSFIASERAPRADVAYLRVPPDLVIEVVSPSDRYNMVRAKVGAWIEAGVRLVWLADPQSRELHVYRSAGEPSLLIAGDEITGEDVIPGFVARVGDLFPS